MSGTFSIAVGVFNIFCGPFLMELFVGEGQQQVVDYGQMYLVVNGVCYFILSLLFIFRTLTAGGEPGRAESSGECPVDIRVDSVRVRPSGEHEWIQCEYKKNGTRVRIPSKVFCL